MSNFYTKKQNILIASAVVLLILGKKEVCIWWLIIVGIIGNIRRLPYTNNVAYFIRMTCYFIVYYIPFLFIRDKVLIGVKFTNRVLVAFLFVLMAAFLMFLIERKEYRIWFSEYAVASLSYKTKYQIILTIYNLIGAVICEEIFFRGYIITMFSRVELKIIISALYFSLSHYLVPWSEGFRKSDYIKQIIMGVVNALLYIYTQSIIPCILMHLVCNFASILLEFKRYERHFLKKSMYDKVLQENIEELLPEL